jgi:hypothetical protein
MSIVWEKNLITTTHRRETPPNGNSVEMVWRVRVMVDGVEGVWDPFTYALNIVDQTLPVPGRKLWLYYPNTTAADWSNLYRCRSVDWRKLDESVSIWECRATFTSKDAICPEPYVWRTDSTTSRVVDAWRLTPPTAGQLVVDNIYSHAITSSLAEYMDSDGVPIKFSLGQQSTTISYIWNTSDATSGPGYPNVAGFLSQGWLKSRNSTTFLGWPAGTVLLDGLTIDPDLDEYVRVSYQFVYDPWGHMTQEPRRYSGERIKKADPGNGFIHAEEVDYKSPFPKVKDFNAFITAAEEDWLTDGWKKYDALVTANACPAGVAIGSVATSYGQPAKAQIGTTAEIREYEEEALP